MLQHGTNISIFEICVDWSVVSGTVTYIVFIGSVGLVDLNFGCRFVGETLPTQPTATPTTCLPGG